MCEEYIWEVPVFPKGFHILEEGKKVSFILQPELEAVVFGIPREFLRRRVCNSSFRTKQFENPWREIMVVMEGTEKSVSAISADIECMTLWVSTGGRSAVSASEVICVMLQVLLLALHGSFPVSGV